MWWGGGPKLLVTTNLGSQDPTNVAFVDVDTFDWNFVEVTDENNNIFIRIPTMYRKINTVTDGQITSFTISDTKIDNDFQPYSCFVHNGNVLPYVLIGKYCSSSTSVMNSVNATYAPQPITPARTNARALGTGYQLYDWQIQKLFVDLVMCHKGSVNFNNGTGVSSYFGIADLTRDIWVDGVFHYWGGWFVALDPADYTSDDPFPNYISLGYACPTTNDYEVSKLGYDANAPFCNLPTAVVNNGSWNTYYCDWFGYSNGLYPILSNVGYPHNSVGLWYTNAAYGWGGSNGVRLCYRPIAE